MPKDADAQAKLRAVFDLSPAVLAITGLDDGRIREVNDAFLQLIGFDRDDVIGRPIVDLNVWVDPAQREEGIALLRGGTPVRDFTARLRVKGGEERVCVLAADLVKLGGEICILTTLTDITDRTRAEEALRESERRFMLAFHANPLPMTITSLQDGRHLEVNDAAVRHSGYTREELLGRPKADLGFWGAPEQRERLMELVREVGHVRDMEVTFRARGGEQRQLLVNAEAITFGGRAAVLTVSLDITERKQLEAQRLARGDEAEAANRAKDQFLAMLGHELRNPLGTIMNAVAVLDTLGADETMRHLTAIIGRQTRHLGRLVDDLLDVARVTSGKIELRTEPVDLHALAARCLDTLGHAGRTRNHHMTLTGASVHVDGDAARLEQVVNNLVDNALKYTPAGGAIAVHTARDGTEAVLGVTDTGRGIDPDVLARVFELFVQEPQPLERARGGLGLGLTLVKRLVELHGGAVSAASAGPGQGSAFTVRLPARAAPEATSAPPAGAIPAAPPARRRVLIVEDNPDARESLRVLLERSGHTVETSEDGPSGLARLEAFRPDVALIDLGLPGIDGYALARLARSDPATRDIRLVALTGYGQADDQRRALDAGFDVHLTKPVDVARLQALLG